jgi:hypothetical protein
MYYLYSDFSTLSHRRRVIALAAHPRTGAASTVWRLLCGNPRPISQVTPMTFSSSALVMPDLWRRFD